MAAAQGGDRAALETLLRRHHDRLYALCRRLTGNDADAVDATQEALDGHRPGAALVRRPVVVLHLGLPGDHQRLPRRAPPAAAATRAGGLRRRPAGAGTGWPGTGAGDRLEGRSARRRVGTSTPAPRRRPLPAEFRAAVVLRDLCDLAYAEIADVLDIPPGTVRSRIARGRAALVPLLPGRREPRATLGSSKLMT